LLVGVFRHVNVLKSTFCITIELITVDSSHRVSHRSSQNAVRANPQLLSQLATTAPALYEAVMSDNLQNLQSVLLREGNYREATRRQQEEQNALYSADPMDPEAQRKIAQMIEQGNINENYDSAMEHTPEAFGRVQMLYVDMEVNGVKLKVKKDGRVFLRLLVPGVVRSLKARLRPDASRLGT
jgi:DNA damage-inducible protein 1